MTSANGPWNASIEEKPFAGAGHWYVVLDTEENGLGEFYGDDHEANVANVRMAAAALDLYEALGAAMSDLDPTMSSYQDAVAARAKASGEVA